MSVPAQPAHKPTSTSTPIPFRESAATTTPEVVGILAITLLLLAAFGGLAWYARRRGWLDRWSTKRSLRSAGQEGLAVVDTIRLSRKSTLYRITDGSREYLLVESELNVELVPVVAGNTTGAQE